MSDSEYRTQNIRAAHRSALLFSVLSTSFLQFYQKDPFWTDMLDRSLMEGEHDDFLFTIVLLLTISGDDLCSLYLSSIFELLSRFLHFLYMLSQFSLATNTSFLMNQMSLLLSATWALNISHSSFASMYFSYKLAYLLVSSLQLAQIYFSASSNLTRAFRIQSVPDFSSSNWAYRDLYLVSAVRTVFLRSVTILAIFYKCFSCQAVTPSLLIYLIIISDSSTSSILLAELWEFSLSARDDSGSLALQITLSLSESNENFLRSFEFWGFRCRSWMKSLISVLRFWFYILTDMRQLLLLYLLTNLLFQLALFLGLVQFQHLCDYGIKLDQTKANKLLQQMHENWKQGSGKKLRKVRDEGPQDDIFKQIEELEKYAFSDSIFSISSVAQEYYPGHQIASDHQEMVLVPKSKLLRVFEQVKLLKKAITSQNKRMKSELQSLKRGIKDINSQKVLLHRQQEYLKDMQRSASEGRIKFYKSSGHFYQPRPFN